MSELTCGFIGMGLIGGSVARTLKERVKNVHIIAYDLNTEAMKTALKQGVADEVADSIDAHFTGCDYLFLCAPVQENDENLTAVKKIISPDTVLTDVGSVKSDIYRHMDENGLKKQFIGGHPMAGSERSGFINSKASLLENVYYILTPSELVSDEKVEAFRALVEQMGAIPLILSCDQHDYATAAVSHLPHIIAASLVNLVRERDNSDGLLKMIAAGGFKDITRIASSSPDMWQQICLTNTDNIVSLLDDYIASLSKIRAQISQRDADDLYRFFDSARTYRDSFVSTSSGPIKISYSINVDITDEPGAFATIATMLALNNINIKNIGISHNREAESGVLNIEFYDEEGMRRGAAILSSKGYTIYEKDL